jgi:hypothetical protein
MTRELNCDEVFWEGNYGTACALRMFFFSLHETEPAETCALWNRHIDFIVV